jgi:hypothetical protein
MNSRDPGLMQCELCSQVVRWNPVGICAACSARLDEEFLKVREALDLGQAVSAPELEAKTGVPLAHIQWLVRTGRLLGKLDVCPVCGAPSQGGLCLRCRTAAERASRRSAGPLFHSHEETPFRSRRRSR